MKRKEKKTKRHRKQKHSTMPPLTVNIFLRFILSLGLFLLLLICSSSLRCLRFGNLHLEIAHKKRARTKTENKNFTKYLCEFWSVYITLEASAHVCLLS